MSRAETLLAADRRGEELRYVTEHFRDLQGLQPAAFWAGLLLLCYIGTVMHLRWWVTMAAFLGIALLAALVWLPWIGHWYERHYGVVTEQGTPASPGIFSFCYSPRVWMNAGPVYRWASLLLLLLLGWSLFFSHRSHGNDFALWIATFYVLPRCSFRAQGNGWLHLRRVLHGVGVLVLLVIFLVGWLQGMEPWEYIGSAAAVMLGLCLYDHWLLTHLLAPRKELAQ